jgi:hypothetical protein
MFADRLDPPNCISGTYAVDVAAHASIAASLAPVEYGIESFSIRAFHPLASLDRSSLCAPIISEFDHPGASFWSRSGDAPLPCSAIAGSRRPQGLLTPTVTAGSWLGCVGSSCPACRWRSGDRWNPPARLSARLAGDVPGALSFTALCVVPVQLRSGGGFDQVRWRHLSTRCASMQHDAHTCARM